MKVMEKLVEDGKVRHLAREGICTELSCSARHRDGCEALCAYSPRDSGRFLACVQEPEIHPSVCSAYLVMDTVGGYYSFHVFAFWPIFYSYPSMEEYVMNQEISHAIKHDSNSNGEFHIKPRQYPRQNKNE